MTTLMWMIIGLYVFIMFPLTYLAVYFCHRYIQPMPNKLYWKFFWSLMLLMTVSLAYQLWSVS